MRKILLAALILCIAVACRQNDPVEETNLSRLLSFYKDTTFTGIFVYPDSVYIDSLFFFKGNQIDSATFNALPEKVTYGLPWTEGFYGLYSFTINDQSTGLLTRNPSKYSSTAISLWVYDRKKDAIVNSILLADIFGDAGAYATINAYLFFDSGQLKALTYRHSSYDHSVEEESDTTFEEYHDFYLTGINFTSVDTLSTDSLRLHEHYAQQLEQMVSY